jgi:hypothetical protein
MEAASYMCDPEAPEADDASTDDALFGDLERGHDCSAEVFRILDGLLADNDDAPEASPRLRPPHTDSDFWANESGGRRDGQYCAVPTSPFALTHVPERRPDATQVWVADEIWRDCSAPLCRGSPTLAEALDLAQLCTPAALAARRAAVARAVSFEDDAQRYLGKQHDVAAEIIELVYDAVAAFDATHVGVSKLALWCVYNSFCSTLLAGGCDARDVDDFSRHAAARVCRVCCVAHERRLDDHASRRGYLPTWYEDSEWLRGTLPLRAVDSTPVAQWPHRLSMEAYVHLQRLSPWLQRLGEASGPQAAHHTLVHFCGTYVVTVARKHAVDGTTTEQHYLAVASALCAVDGAADDGASVH